MSASCKLCEKKRAKRYCPGSEGEICPSCCGSERENSIDCPSSCVFLQEARLHERPAPLLEGSVPNLDIELTENFIERHEPLILFLCVHIRLGMEKAGATDADAREALEGMIRTYRTLQSGLLYEAATPNPYAAAIQDEIRAGIQDLRKLMLEKQGSDTLRDADILGCLTFVQRLELQRNNGRRKGRAFLDFLRAQFPVKPAAAPPAEAPMIQL